MKFLLLIYSDPKARPEPGMMDEYAALRQEVEKRGIFHGAEQLQRAHTARTVSVRDGEVLTTDGPYAETKEQLGGYYVLECESSDEAVGWASRIPGARWGYVEVRPIVGPDEVAEPSPP